MSNNGTYALQQLAAIPAFFPYSTGGDWNTLTQTEALPRESYIVVEPWQWVPGDNGLIYPPVATLSQKGALLLGYVETNDALATAPAGGMSTKGALPQKSATADAYSDQRPRERPTGCHLGYKECSSVAKTDNDSVMTDF